MREKFRPWRDYLETILIAILLALIVRTFICSGYKVPTGSMAPTLLPGDFIFAYRLPFGLPIPLTDFKIGMTAPVRGNVVVFTYPDQPRIRYVKRVIGLPGDQIRIQGGEIYINESKLIYQQIANSPNSPNSKKSQNQDSYFKTVREIDGTSEREILVQKDGKSRSFGPIVVPPNEVFLLGDNRDTSDDSRYWGTVPMGRVESKVILIWLSLDWQAKALDNRFPSLRWGRVMKGLD